MTVCPNSEFQWPLVTQKIDKGHKGVQEKASSGKKGSNVDKDAAGKALKRKHDGNKYVDDNNSTSDFEVVEASASLSKE
ncbi:hypothetical protein JCM6294_2352 [Bacteroides pyogenes DSM 20611 = JCM 6294]|uniref:Uncharacterized protein n=1 Tax=Bacteroides pyogenes DSM 20611 = JCM 6294 TaxID=1121100 RepID=W4PHM5_9BACE|nr:hypothetical protein JCM6294_2352 [Bacteroides pyogenes DSM 20611 = JCM 6294]